MQGRISRRKLADYAADAAQSGSLTEAIREIAAYMIESRRVREVQLVVRAIEDELAARGVVVARVATARPLESDLKKQIAALVNAREIHIAETLEPELIGGVRIETPGKILHATVKSKLLALRQAKI